MLIESSYFEMYDENSCRFFLVKTDQTKTSLNVEHNSTVI